MNFEHEINRLYKEQDKELQRKRRKPKKDNKKKSDRKKNYD